MIDGVLNNTPSPGEVEAKLETGEVSEQPQTDAPEQPEAPEQTPVRYYTINEGAARRAKEANSFYDYQPGSATAEYRSMVDKAVEIAQRQKKRVDPEFHEKIDQLLDTYAYYRKHKTLEGCPHLSQKSIEAFQSGVAEGGGGSPFLPWQLSNNNAEIRRLKARIEQLNQHKEAAYVGWEFDGGTVEINREANRLQIFFEGKPDEATRNILKENSFRWSPKAGAWQRQLNDNTFRLFVKRNFSRDGKNQAGKPRGRLKAFFGGR